MILHVFSKKLLLAMHCCYIASYPCLLITGTYYLSYKQMT